MKFWLCPTFLLELRFVLFCFHNHQYVTTYFLNHCMCLDTSVCPSSFFICVTTQRLSPSSHYGLQGSDKNGRKCRSKPFSWDVWKSYVSWMTEFPDKWQGPNFPFRSRFWEDEGSTAIVSFISHPLNYFQNRVPIYPHVGWDFGKDTCVKLYNSTSILQRVYHRLDLYRVAQNTCMCMFHMYIYIVQINVPAPYVHRTRSWPSLCLQMP